MTKLTNSFPPDSIQITEFVTLLRQNSGDPVRFKVVVRDFLVVLREFQLEDTAELFNDEKEAAQQKKLEEERERAINVPGMLKVRSLFLLWFYFLGLLSDLGLFYLAAI